MVGIIVILVGVFYVAIGRGGELAYEQADHAPLDLGPVSATDVALLRPPTALWGYNMQVTDEALDHIARALRDRDILIASLQRQLNDTSRGMTVVAPSPGASLTGATGLTQAARWDEVIPPRDEVIPARDEAATALDEPATALDEPTAAFGESTTALDGTSAETDVIDAAGPATIDMTATESGATTEQPRRFVPKHERPRRSRRTEPPTPASAPQAAETAEPGEAAAEAAPPDKAGEADMVGEADKADKAAEDAEEEGW